MKARLSAVFALLSGAFALGALVPFAIRDASPLYGELPLATSPGGIVTVAIWLRGYSSATRSNGERSLRTTSTSSSDCSMARITVTYPFLRDGVEHYAHLRSVPLDETTPLAYKIVVGVKVAAWIFFGP